MFLLGSDGEAVEPSTGSFSQACTRTAEPRVAQPLLRPRCTFGRTAFWPSFSLPVGCHPTLVPEAGEVRFLQGAEPRQVNKETIHGEAYPGRRYGLGKPPKLHRLLTINA